MTTTVRSISQELEGPNGVFPSSLACISVCTVRRNGVGRRLSPAMDLRLCSTLVDAAGGMGCIGSLASRSALTGAPGGSTKAKAFP